MQRDRLCQSLVPSCSNETIYWSLRIRTVYWVARLTGQAINLTYRGAHSEYTH